MKVVQINPYCGKGSTGKICQSISERLVDNQIENYILYTQYNSDYNLKEIMELIKNMFIYSHLYQK